MKEIELTAVEKKALKQLQQLQASNCKKYKPWRKSTGPRTKAGKKKSTKNLPSQGGCVSQLDKNLKKIEKILLKNKAHREKKQRQRLAEIKKLEKLATKAEKESNELSN
jgi:hypothetical protein